MDAYCTEPLDLSVTSCRLSAEINPDEGSANVQLVSSTSEHGGSEAPNYLHVPLDLTKEELKQVPEINHTECVERHTLTNVKSTVASRTERFIPGSSPGSQTSVNSCRKKLDRRSSLETYDSESSVSDTTERKLYSLHYQCQVCGKLYKQVRTYRAHLVTHQTISSLTCDICDASLPTKLDYLTHLKMHGRTDLHCCEICGKYFRDNGTLAAHLRIHTGDRPFRCDSCGKTFKQTSTLRRHYKIHSETLKS